MAVREFSLPLKGQNAAIAAMTPVASRPETEFDSTEPRLWNGRALHMIREQQVVIGDEAYEVTLHSTQEINTSQPCALIVDDPAAVMVIRGQGEKSKRQGDDRVFGSLRMDIFTNSVSAISMADYWAAKQKGVAPSQQQQPAERSKAS